MTQSVRYVHGEGCFDKPHILFLGEAPGENESIEGRPFIGRSGQLLRKLMDKYLPTDLDIYITNVVKVRPPDNRKPSLEELLSWLPILEEEIRKVDPQVIVCLGKTAASAMDSIEMGDFQIIRTYHPSYALRNPMGREELEKTMSLLGGHYGAEVRQRDLEVAGAEAEGDTDATT